MAKPVTITKHQLAELLGNDFKVGWIEEKCRTRQIPHLLIAGQYRFTDQHVAEIVAMHERRPVERLATTPPQAAEPQGRRRSPRVVDVLAPVTSGGMPLRARHVDRPRRRPAS